MTFLKLERLSVFGVLLVAACAAPMPEQQIAEPGNPADFVGKACSGQFKTSRSSGAVTITVTGLEEDDGAIVGTVSARPSNLPDPHGFNGVVDGSVADVTTDYGEMHLVFGRDALTGTGLIYNSGTRVRFSTLTCETVEEASTS